MIQSLKLFIRLTNGRTAWSTCHDGFRGGFMQECGRLWSVKLTERVSVGERSWKNGLCKRGQRSNCVLATVWNKCTTIIGKLFCVSFHWHSTAQSPFIFDGLFPPPPFWQDEVRLSREQFCLINLLLDENNRLGIATGVKDWFTFPQMSYFPSTMSRTETVTGPQTTFWCFFPT